MALPDFFSNKKATEDGTASVEAPAFSLTKVQTTFGALIVLIAGAEAKLHGPTAVKVAAIGGAALVMLGIFALAAVDLIARQRAHEAKLRWGSGAPAGGDGNPPDGPITLLPDEDGLVLQQHSQDEEFGIRYLELEGKKVTIVARRKGKTLSPTFQPRS